MRSAADAAAELGEERDYKPMGRAGYEGENWILIDFVHLVLHVFNSESRIFYDLDGLWGDAPRVAWEMDGKKESDTGGARVKADEEKAQ
jgi:ribosome-associated protein